MCECILYFIYVLWCSQSCSMAAPAVILYVNLWVQAQQNCGAWLWHWIFEEDIFLVDIQQTDAVFLLFLSDSSHGGTSRFQSTHFRSLTLLHSRHHNMHNVRCTRGQKSQHSHMLLSPVNFREILSSKEKWINSANRQMNEARENAASEGFVLL